MNLSELEREELEGLQRKRTAPVAQVRRAKLILLLDDGVSRDRIMNTLGCDSRFIATWRARFAEERLAGLYGRHPGRAPRRNLPRLEARVLDYTLKRKPKDGSTHWSSRKLAAELGISFMDVQRIWRRHDLKPHRVDRHMVSNDPDFEIKAADVIGLYLNPPANAAVFCVDEKTAIQALDRKDRMLPLSPGRAESHGFEYKRNGTLSLFAALNTATGEVVGKTAARHTSAQFVAFLSDVVASQPKGREIHVICDNVWLIDERLAFHNYLASDKTLNAMPITGNDSTKEPDLLSLRVFDNPLLVNDQNSFPLASITVVEIKRPMRNDMREGEDKDPIDQALGYVERIREGQAKTKSGLLIPRNHDIPAYCYIVCDLTSTMVKRCKNFSLTMTADGMGFFGYNPNYKAYIEVISFNQLVRAAKERNRAFFDKLGLPSM